MSALALTTSACGCAVRQDGRGAPQPGMSATEPPAPTAVSTMPAIEDVSALLEPIHRKHKLPALAGAIVRPSGATALGATGLRMKGDATPVTVEDRWHLGSNTKAMTATLIAVLVEEGRLKWSTAIADVFPELAERMDAAYRDVTIELLLSHHGGAPADLMADGLWLRLLERRGSPTEQRLQLVEGVVTRPPEAPPGTKFIYSNAGYAIAGAMAERVTGQPWETLMQERLFRPLGITTAGFGAPGDPNVVDQPRGHSAGWFSVTPVTPGPSADNPPAIGPAGTVHMSLGDYAKFIALHLSGERADALDASGTASAVKLGLSPAAFRKLHTPAGDDYALGWGVVRRDWGGTVLTHAGSNTMWYVVAWLAPEKGFAVIVATNQGGTAAERACDEAAGALVRHALKPPRDEAP